MKVLITGAGGQLGRELVRQATASGCQPLPLDHDRLDIANPDRIHDLVAQQAPELIINAAAYTQVDRAEKEARQAFEANDRGPGNIAAACAGTRIPLIHVSTDYVFDGTKAGPYTETDPVSPLGVYGQSKEAGERRIRSALDAHLIVRTSWLYGVYGHNFVKTMIKLGRERESVRVVADQYGCPTSAADLAHALLTMAHIIEKEGKVHWGTYHYCGLGVTTWHGFTRKIIESAKSYCPMAVGEIIPVTTADFPTDAQRPAYSALDCRKIQENFDIHPVPWEESLRETIGRIMEGR